MSKTWKWIFGIILGFIVLVGVGFVAANFFGYGHMAFWGAPAFDGRPMMDDYGFRTFRHPMMGGRWFGGFGVIGLPFLFFGGLLRLIFPLGVLALVAFFAFRAGKQAGWREAQRPNPAEPVEEEIE